MLPTWNTGVILFLFLITEVMSLCYQRRLTNDVSYNELIKLNATCNGLDSCQVHRSTENLRFVNCHCNRMCMELDTCCVDSEYRRPGRVHQSENRPYCRVPLGVTSEAVFFVDKCSPEWSGEDSVKDLCHSFTLNDPFLIVPVSNLRTGLTYRNYFCFICNHPISGTNSPAFWNLKFFSESPNISKQSFPDLKYEYKNGDWMIGHEYVYISAEIPNRMKSRLKWCRQNVWETCPSDWTDDAIRKKCESSYTAMVSFIGTVQRYKNPHCAICHNEDLSKIICTEEDNYSTARGPPYGYLFNGVFSLEDKVKRCPRNQVFDKFSNKCRAFSCGRKKKVVDGECVDNPSG